MQKQIFVELQKQKELNISTWDVVSFIKNNIGNKIITTF
jgi:hypothetical protein